jgi:hypothetical protein
LLSGGPYAVIITLPVERRQNTNFPAS